MSAGLFFNATIFLEGLLAGVFVGSGMMEQAAKRLDGRDWVAYNQAKDTIYGPGMPVFFGVTLLFAIAAAFVAPDQARQVVAAACLVVVGIITAVVHVPLNRLFQTWSPSAVPQDWNRWRKRWRNWNLPRCFLSVLAFAVTAWR